MQRLKWKKAKKNFCNVENESSEFFTQISQKQMSRRIKKGCILRFMISSDHESTLGHNTFLRGNSQEVCKN